MRNSPITTSPRRLLIACAALASIGFASVTQADTLEKIKDSNSVRIGYANETPFAYTALDGSVTGESPEIVRKVFERMEIGTIKPVLTEWGSLIPGLRAGRFDLIAAGMYITPERCKQVLSPTRITACSTPCWWPRATRRSCAATRTSPATPR